MFMSYAYFEEKYITWGNLWHTSLKRSENLKTVNKEHFKIYVINDASSVS